MKRKELEELSTQFDCSDVTWEIVETKRRDKIHVLLTAETRFNLIKIYLSLKMITEKLELHLGVMEDAEGEH